MKRNTATTTAKLLANKAKAAYKQPEKLVTVIPAPKPMEQPKKENPMKKTRIMTDAEVLANYGKANKTGAGYLVAIDLPFPLYINWAPPTKVNRLSCHKKIAEPLLNVFKDLLAHYGERKLHELQIDDYGGCFNYRFMRGSTQRLSRHAWGIAIDLDPDRNQLRESKSTARFARPEYKPMIDIFYKHGFVGYGPEKDYDWMHFEIGI